MSSKGKRGSRKRSTKKKVEEPEETPEEVDSEEKASDPVEDSEEGGSGEDSEEGDSGEDSESEAPESTEEKGKAPETSKKAPKKGEAGKRYFKILAKSIESKGSPAIKPDALSSGGGRYTGNNPMQAAKKAFTRISRAGAPGGECSYVFKIQETTQGSAKKIFEYEGIREELAKPQAIKKGDTEYFIRFHSKVRSYKRNTSAKKATSKKATSKKTRRKK